MGIVITSKIAAPVSRSDFEKRLFTGVQVGLPGWDRAHSQGAGTGKESSRGILYAPADVNRNLQNDKLERFIREFFKLKAPDVELYLTTDTTPWPGTLRLQCIDYKLDAKRGSKRRTLFEASIEIENKRQSPRISISASPYANFEDFLPAPSPKKK
jgi:hypothetical protein